MREDLRLIVLRDLEELCDSVTARLLPSVSSKTATSGLTRGFRGEEGVTIMSDGIGNGLVGSGGKAGRGLSVGNGGVVLSKDDQRGRLRVLEERALCVGRGRRFAESEIVPSSSDYNERFCLYLYSHSRPTRSTRLVVS